MASALELLSFLRILEALEALEAVAFSSPFQEARQHLAKRVNKLERMRIVQVCILRCGPSATDAKQMRNRCETVFLGKLR